MMPDHTHRRSFRLPSTLLLTGLVATTAIKLWVVDHGLPHIYEEATPVRQAWEIWNWGRPGLDPNPAFFNYPALTFYLNWLPQAAWYVLGSALGAETTAAWESTSGMTPELVLLGRLISLSFGVAAAWGVYRIGRRLLPAVWAAWSGVASSFMLMPVTFSLISAVDLPLLFFTTLALHDIAVLPWRNRRQHHLRIGLWIGLAASCKYTGAVLAVPYVVSGLCLHGRPALRWLRSRDSWMAGAVTVVVFFAINPFILLDYPTFSLQFGFERWHMTLGHFGQRDPAYIVYSAAFVRNLGLPLALFAFVGIAAALGGRNRRRWVPLLAFLVAYLVLLGLFATSFDHYLIPVLPVLLLLSVSGLRTAMMALRRRTRRSMPGTAVLVPCLLWLAWPSARHTLDRRTPDTRTLAGRWIREAVPAGSTFASEMLSPTASRDHPRVLIPLHSTAPEITQPFYQPGWYDPIDYFLVSGAVSSRYQAEADRFPAQVSLYQFLSDRWELVHWQSSRDHPGPDIWIYRNPDGRRDVRAYSDHLYEGLAGAPKQTGRQFLDNLAAVLLESGNLSLAGDVYDYLVRHFPEQTRYVLRYADILQRVGKREWAVELLESQVVDDEHYRAMLHYYRGEYAAAAVKWGRLAAGAPEDFSSRKNLAAVNAARGDTTGAIRWYREALALNPQNIAVREALGELLLATGAPAEAANVYAQGLEIDPTNVTFHLNLGITRVRSGDTVGAVQVWKAGIAAAPDSPRLHNNLATAYAILGEHDLAIETLRAAVKAHPDVPYLRERLSALERRR